MPRRLNGSTRGWSHSVCSTWLLVNRPLGPKTEKLLVRSKEYLFAHFTEPIRLADVGKAVGASPIYLTDLFRRVEGMSLHRYIVRLRLNYALDCLPSANDLTTLALQSGFSSHSHFTHAFGRAFGLTPSEFRAFMRQTCAALRSSSREPVGCARFDEIDDTLGAVGTIDENDRGRERPPFGVVPAQRLRNRPAG